MRNPILRRDRNVALVDIASGSVHVSIITLGQGPAKVRAHAQTPLSTDAHTKKIETAAISTAVRETGQKVLDSYMRQGGGVIEEIYVVLHVPYSESKTGSVIRDLPDEERIQSGLILELRQQAIGAMTQTKGTELIEAGALKVLLNGYSTNAPIGKYAHQIELIAIATECSQELKKNLESAIWSLFPASAISWRSGTRALLTIERRLDPKERNYIAVVVGSDSTHLMRIDKHVLSEQRIVDEGIRTILEKAGGGRTAEETFGYIRMLAREACEGEACESIQKSLAALEPDLVRAFGDAFGSLCGERKLPTNMLLVADEGLAEWFAKFFARIDFTQFTATSLPMAVRIVSPHDMAEWVSSIDPIDSSLAVSAALVNIESNTKS